MGLTLVVPGRRGGLKEPNLPPPLQCPPDWLRAGEGTPDVSFPLGSSLLHTGSQRGRWLTGSVSSVSTPAGIFLSMLWSLSPGKPSRASPYRNCECEGIPGARVVCVRVCAHMSAAGTVSLCEACHCVCMELRWGGV